MNTQAPLIEQESEILEEIKSAIEATLSYPLFYSSSGELMGETSPEDAEKNNEPICISCTVYAQKLLQIKIGIARESTPSGMTECKEVLETMTKVEGPFTLEHEMYTLTLYESLDEFSQGQLRLLENKLVAVKELIEIINRNIQDPRFANIKQKYKDIPGVEPIYPLEPERVNHAPGLDSKVGQAITYLSAGLNVAITSESSVIKDYVLSCIAGTLLDADSSMATCTQLVPLRGLPELIQKIPGYVEFSAVSLSMTSSPYERSDDVHMVLSAIKKHGKPAVFSGTYADLQGVFGLGQGTVGDPKNPVLIKLDLEDVKLSVLVEYQLSLKDISTGRKNHIREQLCSCIENRSLNFSEIDLIPSLIQGSMNSSVDMEKLLASLKAPTDTFRGFKEASDQKRNPLMQQNLINAIESGQLGAFFKAHLIGQEKAINQIIERLSSEILTKKQHLPIAMLCQGLPGTGKTEASKLLAQLLKIPHKIIDASHFNSGYDLKSTLYGSSTGIVQSYNPGLLELAAGHTRGCVVEVSDIDHAKNVSVRAQIGDSFLSILQEGLIQTATGKTVFCGNVIFIFTINLPGQADERVLKGLGFRSDLSEEEIFRNTMKEMRKMFSTAYISRIGTPILYTWFSRSEQVQIAEMAIRKGVESCLENLFLSPRKLIIEQGSGDCLLNTFFASGEYIGARQIYEHVNTFLTEQISPRLTDFRNTDPDVPLRIGIDKNRLILDF